jgi:hypothetical protein
MNRGKRRLVPLSVSTALLVALVAFGFPCLADVLHLKSGGTIEGKVVGEEGEWLLVRTRFGVQRIRRADVVRIEEKATAEEEYDERLAALDPDDPKGHLELARWCREHRMTARWKHHLERVVALDPSNAEAQEGLGRVLHDGRWVTPEEKAELVRREQIAERRARGLVPYRGEWVTREEREARENGLVLHEGKWLTPEEAMEARGFVRVDGAWVRRRSLENREEVEEMEKRLGLRLKLEDSEHFSIRSELDREHIEELQRDLEKGHRLFHETFGIEGDLLGGRMLPVVELIEGRRFREYLGMFALRHDLSEEWVRIASQAQGIYHFDPPLIADFQASRGPGELVNSAVNKLGKILANLWHFRPNYLPAWFEEGIGIWLEVEVRGSCLTFTIAGPGSGARDRYKRQADVGRRFDPSTGWILVGEWEEMLREEVRAGRDTPLERLLSLSLPELSTMDVAKSWSVVRYLVRRDPRQLGRFVQVMRRDLPRYESHVTPRRRTEIQREAIEEVYGVRVLAIEEAWKGYLKP